MSVCQVPQESQATVAPILAGIFGSLALAMVIVRVWQRITFKQIFGWDDGLIVAALLCAGPLNCMMFPSKSAKRPRNKCQRHECQPQFPPGFAVGLGTNMWTLSFDNITKVFKVSNHLDSTRSLI